MLTEKQTERMLDKLKQFEETLENLMFRPVEEVSMGMYQTSESLDRMPDRELFHKAKKGDIWGGEGKYCWFAGDFVVPEYLDGKDLYLKPEIGGYEAMLWIDGVPYGIYTSKIIVHSHGNHYCNLMKKKAEVGEHVDIALEYYAHHYVMGTQPFSCNPHEKYEYSYNKVSVCLKDQEISDFYFDLKIVNQMTDVLDKNSFRRADIINTLYQIHQIIYYDYENAGHAEFMEALRKAEPLLCNILSKKNSETTPFAGLIGHSHMDTAWLWHQRETLKKCARTYSNQMNLMDQYPNYTFIQSSAYHGALMKEHYPELFEQMKNRIAEGRYEPNGGAWIECDCNLPSGESMIRQFLWGQRFTMENYGYRSDSFWLPDTFGYSVSLPQIMQGCGIRYFLTTKLGWNDTNVFPYDTFYWKGLDGSKVLVHFNRTHIKPDPKSLMEYVVNGEDSIKEKTVSNMRLLSYGYGDGGGGPEFEMIEMAERLKDVEGLPRAEHTTVSQFMNQLEKSLVCPTTYNGELYLELHRGTLTNNHTIKRNNRLAEIALHNLEYLIVRDAVNHHDKPDLNKVKPLVGILLKNQFHDILPGTCIPRANQEAICEMNEMLAESDQYITELLEKQEQECFTVTNTLSFDRNDVIYLDYYENHMVEGDYAQQIITDVNGSKKLAVAGIHIPAYSSVTLNYIEDVPEERSCFVIKGKEIITPLLKAVLDSKGYLESLVDLEENRELRGKGYPLNTLLIGEEVSKAWDCWDVDADFECRLKDQAILLSQKVVDNGQVELRLRSKYQLTEKSSMIQDMIFYKDTKEVRFETLMDWQDDHRFLKAAFDTDIFSDFARQEVQFGYIKRSTSRNNSEEKAKFEVSNYKYTDLSETRYGAAILNDCKYGISVDGSSMHLSLHKGGCRPDYRGDKGVHYCNYAFLPHNSGFHAQSVIRPSYLFNIKPIISKGKRSAESFLTIDADNIIAETIKPAEDGEKAFVIRLYEAEGTKTASRIFVHLPVVSAVITNMLEETESSLEQGNIYSLLFRPFEVKTIKIYY